jgi:transposase
LPERIKAHAMLCFIALIIYRVMRQRLKMAKSELSPEKALAQLRKIQHHSVRINNTTPVSGISTIQETQAKVYEALNLKKPTQNTQMSLL